MWRRVRLSDLQAWHRSWPLARRGVTSTTGPTITGGLSREGEMSELLPEHFLILIGLPLMIDHGSQGDPSVVSESGRTLSRCGAIIEELLAVNERTGGPLSGRRVEAKRKPFVFVLGNHSSGKSSFINHALGREVQESGTGEQGPTAPTPHTGLGLERMWRSGFFRLFSSLRSSVG